MAAATGQRLHSQLLVGVVPEWQEIQESAQNAHRKAGTVIALLVGALILSVTVSTVSGDDSWWFILVFTLVLGGYWLYQNDDVIRLHQLVSGDVYDALYKMLGSVANDAPTDIPARVLDVGDIAVPHDERKDSIFAFPPVMNSTYPFLAPVPISLDLPIVNLQCNRIPRPFKLVVARRPSSYDENLKVGLSSGDVIDRSAEWQYRLGARGQAPSLQDSQSLIRAAAVADLMEVICSKPPPSRLFVSGIDGKTELADHDIREFVSGWCPSDTDFHHAVRTVLEVKFATWVCPGSAVSRASHGEERALRVLEDITRTFGRDPDGPAWKRVADLVKLPPRSAACGNVLEHIIRMIRPTNLGELWRDADRPIRNRAARNSILIWLDHRGADFKNPAQIRDFPAKSRAIDRIFLSHKDLIDATHFLQQNGLVECSLSERGGDLNAWPTKRGVDCVKRREDITEYLRFESPSFTYQEFVMGDKYNIGNAGAAGPGASAHNVTFTQAGQTINFHDPQSLAVELAQVITELRARNIAGDQTVVIDEVSSARDAAESGDDHAVLAHLARAGKLALDVAKSIGAMVAAAAIQRAMGI